MFKIMKKLMIKRLASQMLLPYFVALACAPAHAAQTPLLGAELASFSVLAGAYATYGPDTAILGTVGAVTYITGALGSSSGGEEINTPRVRAAVAEIDVAQQALTQMGAGTRLAAQMSGAVTLAPGVYDVTSLTTAAGTNLRLDGGGADAPVWVFNISTFLETGAATLVSLINAGAHTSVLWNIGDTAMIGDETTFIGTLLAASHISEASGVNMQCGQAFSKSYISIAANSKSTSSPCAATDTWTGSEYGLASNMVIVEGRAEPASTVPEPQTYALLLAGGACLALRASRRKVRICA